MKKNVFVIAVILIALLVGKLCINNFGNSNIDSIFQRKEWTSEYYVKSYSNTSKITNKLEATIYEKNGNYYITKLKGADGKIRILDSNDKLELNKFVQLSNYNLSIMLTDEKVSY